MEVIFRRCKSDVFKDAECPSGDACPLVRFLKDARARENNPKKLEEYFYDTAHKYGNSVRLTMSGVEVMCDKTVPAGPREFGVLTISRSGE